MMVKLIPIVVIVVLILLVIIFTYNKLIDLRMRVKEAFATMDVYLTKRYDLIPNLVETVKGYTKHESETLENVIKARNIAMNGKTNNERIEGENMLSGCLKSIFALSESYPELKADKQFLNLQEQLQGIENDITNARKYYNAVVRNYNTSITVFPNNIVASMFKFEPATMFEVADERVRDNVKVSF